MRKWFLALALIAVPLAFSATALAVPPTTEVDVVVDSVTVDSDICADFGFDVTFVENGTFKTKTYQDSEGNKVAHPHELEHKVHLQPRRRTERHSSPTTHSFSSPAVMGTSGTDSATHTTSLGQESSSSTRGASSSTSIPATSSLRPASTSFSMGRSTHSRLLRVIDIQGRPLQRGAANGPSRLGGI